MTDIEKLLVKMQTNPKGIRYMEACRVCEHFFGEARQNKSSHRVYKTPWSGDPRVNIQNDKGNAKVYQVKQILRAIERLRYENK